MVKFHYNRINQYRKMRRVTRYILRFVFFYLRITGLMPFSYNPKTRRVRTSRAITIYSIFANLLLFALVPLILFPYHQSTMIGNAQYINQLLYSVTLFVRSGAVVISFLFNWHRRCEFISVIRTFNRLHRQYFSRLKLSQEKQQQFENSIISKFIWISLTEFGSWGLTMQVYMGKGDKSDVVGMASICVLTSVLNLVVNEYYFGVLNVNLGFTLINDELLRIMHAARSASKNWKRYGHAGVYITRCCQLSDDIDELAIAHYKLRKLALRLNRMFNTQGACSILNMYLNNVATFYTIYKFIQFKTANLPLDRWGVVLLAIILCSYYADLHNFLKNMMNMLELYTKGAFIIRMLMPLQCMDIRLERSIKSFCEQIVNIPLQYNMMGMTRLDKPMIFAILSSTFSNAILIMQYDIKYSRIIK
ncbi:putative gustatory receptor 59d [Teleopsis dalmanni]|uniref:putative gustatory receptor 59d n=1 Tax=Teleopsis dalmanni TaxID=139649 RepID=UPI0018CE1614|nr:putative gustatory receptor 59d [Teleopsis dalmanni]